MMHASQDTSLHTALQPIARRLAYIVLLEGCAAGFVFASAIAVAGWLGKWETTFVLVAGAVALVAVALLLLFLSARRRREVRFLSRLVETKAACRNLLVTASELSEVHSHVPHEVKARVQREAVKLAGTLEPRSLFPARKAIIAITASAALWALFVIAIIVMPALPGELQGASGASTAITSIDITVVPPEYAHRVAQRLHNPDRIEALAGSRIQLSVRGRASSVSIETLASTRWSLSQTTPGEFSTSFVGDADGFIALEPVAADGSKGTRRLVGLTVIPDHPPVAHLTAPGRDLFIPDPHRTIDIAVEATDDIGLAALGLRYTRVSGAGEQFTFTDGEVPLSVTRTDSTNWLAKGSWNLDSLHLAPGDIVVYRAVVGDRRPGAAPSESDTFIVEITGPGALAAGGFTIDEEHDRYAISQQMVILKSERLLARKPTMSAEAYGLESNDIAAEQRKVRAEFVFMMGGELADEIAPELTGTGDLDERSLAAVDDEAISGRLANNGRLDLVRALRSMSHASAELVSADLPQALVAEKEALTFLQRAFSRTRYILRTLTERERLDQARRMTGVMSGAASDRRPAFEPQIDTTIAALRAVLAEIASIAGSGDFDEAKAARSLSLALSVLKIDPASEPLQRVAAGLTNASRAGYGYWNDAGRQRLSEAATELANFIRTSLPSAPQPGNSLQSGILNGALTDALRRGGSPR